jgi:hypothetical protein
MTMQTTMQLINLAADPTGAPGQIPGSKPKPIEGLSSTVGTMFDYGLWILMLAGAGGTGFGVYKLAVSDKSRSGGGSEPFKWMGAGVATILLSGSLITILNGIAG